MIENDISGYTIAETVSNSESSAVFRAIRKKDNQVVVIKTSSKEYPSFSDITRARLEYDLLRQLSTDGVIAVHGFERHGNTPYMFMEEFSSTDLSIFKERGIPLPLFFNIAVQIVDALNAIHHKQIVHRDINPRNILINLDTQRIKIIDFNIAIELTKGTPSTEHPGAMEGSIEYISPEQTGRTNRAVDYRSDYYSLGATLFELLTGACPFQADDPLGYVHCHLSKPPPSPSDLNPSIPVALSAIVLKLLRKDPRERYQSGEGLKSDLERVWDAFQRNEQLPVEAIGQNDISPIFHLSGRPVGRQAELNRLNAMLRDIRSGNQNTVIVSGDSGIGKTALVNEMKLPVSNCRGYFATGRFTSMERNIPFSAVSKAFNALALELLTQSDDQIAEMRTKLTWALGHNAKMLIDIIPELDPFITSGTAPAIEDPDNAVNRLKVTFRHLLEVVCTRNHPLLLFLDDYQWSDESSRVLIKDWVESDTPYFFLIVAGRRRTNNYDKNLDIVEELLRFDPAVARVHHLALSPLSEEAVSHLVADTFSRSIDDARALGGAIFGKTHGHPHFTAELIQLLNQKGQVHFSQTAQRWEWDLVAVEREPVSDNLVDLLLARLELLPKETRSALMLASLIGFRFSLSTLAGAGNRTITETAAQMTPALEHGIILPLGQAYRLSNLGELDPDSDADIQYAFTHNRIHQSIYATVSEINLPILHRHIGDHLLSKLHDKHQDSDVFEIVNHLNLGLTEAFPMEARQLLSELNLAAGKKAEASSAFAVATGYYRSGLEVIATSTDIDPDLIFQLSTSLVRALHLSGNPLEALALTDALLAEKHDKEASATIYLLKASVLEHAARFKEAMETLQSGLAELGVDFPLEPAAVDKHIIKVMDRTQLFLVSASVDDLENLGPLSDPKKHLVMKLLHRMVPSAIQSNIAAFVLAELTMFDIAITDGISSVSPKNFMDFGIIQAGILEDIAGAEKLSDAAFRLLKRDAASQHVSAVSFVYATFVAHWLSPNREAFVHFDRAWTAGIESGDIGHALYALVHRLSRYLYVGRSLDECAIAAEETFSRLKKMKGVVQRPLAAISKCAIDLLRNTDGIDDRVTALKQELVASTHPQNLHTFGQTQAMVSFILGEYEQCVQWSTFAAGFPHAGNGRYPKADYILFRALSLIYLWSTFTPEERAEHELTIADAEARLDNWARFCEENFAHKRHLLRAEKSRRDGAPLEEVLIHFKHAETSIGKGEFPQFQAIINERQACLWDDLGLRDLADLHLTKAYRFFEQWGAKRKLLKMERHYASRIERAHAKRALTRSAFNTDSYSLDFSSLMKASIAISSEIKLDRVLAQLTSTLVESAGAEKAVLVLKYTSTNRLAVEAVATVNGEPRVLCNEPVDASEAVCPNIVKYVAGTERPLMFGNAYEESHLKKSAYLERHRTKSLLCLPIIHRNTTTAIVYLENNLLEHAFSDHHVTILKTIATPAAIALENAFVYQHLDELVQKKTAELESTQAKLVENAHKAGMSEIASSILHNVGNILNNVKTSGQIIHETALASKIEKLIKANALLEANMDRLQEFIVNDQRGIKLFQYYLELGRHLRAEKASIEQNARQLLSGIDAITDIVAEQQNYAYANVAVRETLPLQDIVESALVLATASFSKHNIQIRKEYDPPVPIPLQKTKMLHTIINLIKNARDAMLTTEETNRYLTIQITNEKTAVVLRVSDTGCGIVDENKPKLFTFGFSTKKDGHGSGLHSSALYVAEMGGEIWVESDGAGHGATFVVSLQRTT